MAAYVIFYMRVAVAYDVSLGAFTRQILEPGQEPR